MNARRLLISLAVLLGLLAFASALAPSPDQAEKPVIRPANAGESEVVDARLPRDKPVRARVGDLVELTVTTTEPETVQFPALADVEVAEPASPARFSFYADRPGRFPVLFSDSNEEAGVIEVRR